MSFFRCLVLVLLAFHHSFCDSRTSDSAGSVNPNIMPIYEGQIFRYPIDRSGVALHPSFAVPNYGGFLYQKREGLIPFPRVGRSGTGPKRNGAGTSGPLWFGPRLGKRTYLDTNSADTTAYDNVPDYFNQNNAGIDGLAVAKAGELQ